MTEPYVRPAYLADLAPLASALGGYRHLADRLNRQMNGQGVLFAAWLGSRPAGEVYLWLEEAEEQPIVEHLPGVALLTHLEVHPELRNRGIGQALVGAAERYLIDREHDRVALAVRTDNVDATRLYQRIGFRDWGHGPVVCYAETTLPDGRVVLEPEHCNVMVKDLAPITPAPRAESRAIRPAHRS